MQSEDRQAQIEQAKTDRKIAKYSQDYDMTITVKGIMIILGSVILGMFVLEASAVFFADKEPGVYLTAAIILAVLAYLAGWISSIVTYFFVKKGQNGQQGSQRQ